MSNIDFKGVLKKASKPIAAKPVNSVLPLESFEGYVKAIASTTKDEYDDTLITLWYGLLQDIPEHYFVECVKWLLETEEQPQWKNIPAVLRNHYSEIRKQEANVRAGSEWRKERESWEREEQVDLETLKRFNQQLKAGEKK